MMVTDCVGNGLSEDSRAETLVPSWCYCVAAGPDDLSSHGLTGKGAVRSGACMEEVGPEDILSRLPFSLILLGVLCFLAAVM